MKDLKFVYPVPEGLKKQFGEGFLILAETDGGEIFGFSVGSEETDKVLITSDQVACAVVDECLGAVDMCLNDLDENKAHELFENVMLSINELIAVSVAAGARGKAEAIAEQIEQEEPHTGSSSGSRPS